MKAITRVILILSLVSLFNDIASEMLMPIMPIYLKSIGFTIVLIGVLEGIAEATASLSKGYFGKISDTSGKRAPFVIWGYSLSAISKPMIGFLTNPLWVFISRTMDRFGKGIRTAARDAILSDESEHADRGKVYGFNRSMDTLGATIGPGLALLFLYLHPEQYRTLFYFSFIPGVVAVALTLLVKDKPKPEITTKSRVSFWAQFKYWKESPLAYKQLVTGLLFFTLFNSADAFLILKLKEAGNSDTVAILMYMAYNLIYALSSFPLGIVADKVGLKKMLLIGLFIFGLVYSGMGFVNGNKWYIVLFLMYGLYYACTEGVSKALLSKICDKKDTATALGVFAGLQSICTLLASTVAGFIWYNFGSFYVFMTAGVAAFVAVIYLAFMQYILIIIKVIKTYRYFAFGILLICMVSIIRFNGLYGQDSYEYLRFTKCLNAFYATGTKPGDFFWPLLYPMLGSVLSFVTNPVFALQLISVAAFAGAAFYLDKTIELIYSPKIKTKNVFIFLFFLLSPYLLRASLVVMSDMLALFFVTGAYYYTFKYRTSLLGKHFFLFVAFAMAAIATRYAAFILLIAPGLAVKIKFLKHFKWKAFVGAAVVAILITIPHVLLRHGHPLAFIKHNWLTQWSPVNYFKNDFVTADGNAHYAVYNILYAFYNLVHPGYCFIGIILLAIGAKYFSFKSKTNFVMLSIVLYAFFLAGIPLQNLRFLLLSFPLVALIFFPAFEDIMSYLTKKGNFTRTKRITVYVLITSIRR